MKGKYLSQTRENVHNTRTLKTEREERKKKKATIYSSCIQHIRYHVKKRYCYKKLSGSFIANISVQREFEKLNPGDGDQNDQRPVLGSFINFATGLANMYTKPTMIEMENRAYLAMFAQNGMSSPAMAICENASRSS